MTPSNDEHPAVHLVLLGAAAVVIAALVSIVFKAFAGDDAPRARSSAKGDDAPPAPPKAKPKGDEAEKAARIARLREGAARKRAAAAAAKAKAAEGGAT